MRHIISVLLENEAGALSRVVGLFSARGYNIETLTVAPTEDATLSRMTIVTSGSDDIIEQITKHLNRLIEVVKVVDLTEDTLGTVSSQTRAVGERAAKLATRAAARSEEISNDLLEAGADAEEKANEAASKIAGAAGAVEGKARTAKDSPAKKMAAAHTTTTNGTAKTTRTSTTKSTPTKSTTTKSTTAKTTPAKSTTKSTGAKDTTSTEE